MFETGLGVGRSLGRKGISVIGLDFKKDIGFYSRYINGYICPHPIEEEKDFVEYLLKFGREQKVKPVLFITSDDFLFSISRNRKPLLKYFLINFPEEDIIESILDKFQQYRLAHRVGILVPKTFFPKNLSEVEEIKNELSYPVFIKAQDVNLWRKNISKTIKGFIVMNEFELITKYQMIFNNGSNAIVQEIIKGPDTNHFKICCYISKKGNILLSFTLQKIRQQPIKFGVGAVVQSIHYPELMKVGEKFFSEIGYRGVGSAEFKLDERDGKLKLIELNPRYWQQNILSEKCGMNFPLIDYLEVTGQNPEPKFKFCKGIKWVNIYMDFDSFINYRREEGLTLNEWLKSLKNRKVFSDFASDDILPAFYEIRFGKRLFKIPQYIFRKIRNEK